MADAIELLALAVEQGDMAAVREMMARGVPVDARIKDLTPLMRAVRQGDLEIAQLLLEHGADADAFSVSRIGNRDHRSWVGHFVMGTGEETACFRLLLSHGASPQPLLIGAVSGSAPPNAPASAVEILLQAGADPNLRDEHGELPLYQAAKSPEKLDLLLRYGARVDARNGSGSEAIHFACCFGWTASVRTLLQHGADPNSLEDWDECVHTPLLYAATRGHLNTARVLLAAGADPNLTPWGPTPLMGAASYGCSEIVEALLRAGADCCGPVRTQDVRTLAVRQRSTTPGGGSRTCSALPWPWSAKSIRANVPKPA